MRIKNTLLGFLFLFPFVANAQYITGPSNATGAVPTVTPNVTNQFVTGYPTAGGPLSQSQPSFSNLSGTLSSAQCLNATTSSIGCVEIGGGLNVTSGIVQLNPISAVSNQWISSINSSGVPQLSQPNTTNIATSLSTLVLGNGTGLVGYAGISCTNQVLTALAANGNGTCSSIANANLSVGPFANITGVGTLNSGATGSGFTLNLSASTIIGILGGANGGTGINNGTNTLTLGANLITTGAGNTTLAFPASTSLYTFPTTSGGDIIPGLNSGNIYTKIQKINLNTALVPNTPLPMGLSILQSDGNGSVLDLLSSAAAPTLRFVRWDSTISSPSTIQNLDTLGNIVFKGYNGSATPTGVSFGVNATQNWSGGANGAELIIQATPNGSNTQEIEAMFQNGVALGAGTPQGLGTLNAPNGIYIGTTEVITNTQQGIFGGGITSTLSSSGASLAYVCYNTGNGVFTYSATTCH